MKLVNEKQITKFPKAVSFSETLTSDIPISCHVEGDTLTSKKKKGEASPKKIMDPKTRSKTKFEALA